MPLGPARGVEAGKTLTVTRPENAAAWKRTRMLPRIVQRLGPSAERALMNDVPQVCTQLDISASTISQTVPSPPPTTDASETSRLLRDMVVLQHRSCELLAELVNQVSLQHRQRNAELKAWKEANPKLATACRHAAESLAKVHAEFLSNIATEAYDNAESFSDSDYALGDFLDRFGPRLAHFNGVLQLLSQLGAQPPQPPAEKPTES